LPLFSLPNSSSGAHTFGPQGDQRLPHDSGREVDEPALARLGVKYFRLGALADVDALAAERGYRNRDEITVSPAALGEAYETKVRGFFAEHLHEDEEIRYVRGGAGYFDVRDKTDGWVRIRLEKDDLIILPAGIYHRFTTDEANVSSPFSPTPPCPPLARDAVDDTPGSTSRLCVCSRTSLSGRLSTAPGTWTATPTGRSTWSSF